MRNNLKKKEKTMEKGSGLERIHQGQNTPPKTANLEKSKAGGLEE